MSGPVTAPVSTEDQKYPKVQFLTSISGEPPTSTSGSRASNALFWTLWGPALSCTYPYPHAHTYTHIHMISKIIKISIFLSYLAFYSLRMVFGLE